MITAYAKAGDVANAELWMKQMGEEKLRANAVTYNMLINACMKANNPGKAEAWFERLLEAGQSPTSSTFHSVAQAYANVASLDDVQRILAKMPEHKIPMDSHGLSIVLGACANSTPRLAAQALQSFRHWVGKGVVVEERTFSALGRAVGYKAARNLCDELKIAMPGSGPSRSVGAGPTTGGHSTTSGRGSTSGSSA